MEEGVWNILQSPTFKTKERGTIMFTPLRTLAPGAVWTNMRVLESADKESFRRYVSVELRNGTWLASPTRAAITSPSADRDLMKHSVVQCEGTYSVRVVRVQ